ncbi:MAG: hypothetical protein RL111_1244 [Pseudomonadota bacterium]|jgi:L-lactate dehydrogenase
MRCDAQTLTQHAIALLQAVGMPEDKAHVVAHVLVEGDLLGHWTHGLRLLPAYLEHIQAGGMTLEGDPEVISERGVVALWDGRCLPGHWLTFKAIEWASEQAKLQGMAAVCIKRTHHIAALAPYARHVAQNGQVLLMMTSAPLGGSVAPFGGTEALFSPSPLGFGYGDGHQPVMVDVSTSSTTNNKIIQYSRDGKLLEHPWLQDDQGRATNDPTVMQRKGTVLPVGGKDSGHKGYGLALTVEALTAGLSGHGRDDPSLPWMGTLFLQIIEPDFFAGREVFAQKMAWVSDRVHANRPIDPQQPVRLPGERGLAQMKQQLASGVELADSTVDALKAWGDKLGHPFHPQTGHGSAT